MLGWVIVAAVALGAVALVGGMLSEAARIDGWPKALWDASALVGIVAVLAGAGFLGYWLLT